MMVLFASMVVFHIGCQQNPMELALVEEAGAVNIMHAFHSEDLKTWTHRGPQAWGVASLGMTQHQNGNLLLMAIQEVRPPNWYEERFGPPVYGFEYDGTSLTPKAWKIEDKDTKAYIDPQFFENQMWYISPSGTFGDPAKRETQMPVRSSNPGQVRYQGVNFADPSPVRFKGELHLFMSKDLHIFHAKGNPLEMVQVHPKVNDIFYKASVPYAFIVESEEEEEIWLTAQSNIQGKRVPVLAKSKDALFWSNWEPIGNIPKSMKNCTSPVMGPDPKGGWIMFCIEELLH